MGIKYLWDTNTVIYYLQKQLSINAETFIDSILLIDVPAISAITEIELLCWKSANENHLVTLKNFIADACVYEIDQEIKNQTAELRKHYNLKLPDAIIAATALVHGMTIVTRNVSDFAPTGVPTLNPWDIDQYD